MAPISIAYCFMKCQLILAAIESPGQPVPGLALRQQIEWTSGRESFFKTQSRSASLPKVEFPLTKIQSGKPRERIFLLRWRSLIWRSPNLTYLYISSEKGLMT